MGSAAQEVKEHYEIDNRAISLVFVPSRDCHNMIAIITLAVGCAGQEARDRRFHS